MVFGGDCGFMMYHSSSRLYEGKTGLRQNHKVRSGLKIYDYNSPESMIVDYHQISGASAKFTRVPPLYLRVGEFDAACCSGHGPMALVRGV